MIYHQVCWIWFLHSLGYFDCLTIWNLYCYRALFLFPKNIFWNIYFFPQLQLKCRVYTFMHYSENSPRVIKFFGYSQGISMSSLGGMETFVTQAKVFRFQFSEKYKNFLKGYTISGYSFWTTVNSAYTTIKSLDNRLSFTLFLFTISIYFISRK